jgi:hypothetical protein
VAEPASSPDAPARARRPYAVLALALAGTLCLVAGVATGLAARAALTRRPTAAERSAAAAAAMATRWRSRPAGQVFPLAISYHTDLLTTETATRIGISALDTCGAAIDASLGTLARHEGCMAGLRAAYIDQLQGIVYTVGVLAFAGPHDAASFLAGLRAAGQHPALRALAFAGTASARFSDPARQAYTARGEGPYVVLTVAGYADGRPAASSGQARPAIFAPGSQLASAVIGPLAAPVIVNCQSKDWSC